MIPKDIQEAAAATLEAVYDEREHRFAVAAIAEALFEERKRVLQIIAAEKEWGGDIDEIERLVSQGLPPRQIEGWPHDLPF